MPTGRKEKRMTNKSQIYILWEVTDKDGKPVNGLIAKSFDWNRGFQMVSRARAIIEKIQSDFLPYKWPFIDETCIKNLDSFCDVDFDRRSVTGSTDLVKIVREQFPDEPRRLFEQDNNDGQLFILVTDDVIKYGFMNYFREEQVMDGEAYMAWDSEKGGLWANWHVPCWLMSVDAIEYTEQNIEKIREMAELMTIEEIRQFVYDSLEYVKGLVREDNLEYFKGILPAEQDGETCQISGMKRVCYEKYKLAWMIRHNHTLDELIRNMTKLSVEDAIDSNISIAEYFAQFEEDCGFNGEVYCCFDEFLENEYLDKEFMKKLLNVKQYEEYLIDIDGK